MNPATRIVSLVLVTDGGELLGALPPFAASTPWWQDAQAIVEGALEHHGVRVTVLRLLSNEQPSAHGGGVTYLAEVSSSEAVAVPLETWRGELEDHPARQPYARPGGPTADLAWADAALATHGLVRAQPAAQIRTWNLSSLWRLPLAEGAAWLKVVPPFFAHEGPLIRMLAGAPVPSVMARDGVRLLLHEIPGEARHEPGGAMLSHMVRTLVRLQADWTSRARALLDIGVRDCRAPALSRAIADVIARTAHQLSASDRLTLGVFERGLAERFAQLEECGLADTLVHGDFHPGNWHGPDSALVLLDWGDSCVGHPLLDQPAFLERVPSDALEAMRALWNEAWRAHAPGSDPARAALLLAPIAAARQAATYRHFLDQIEPSEHPYHATDPAIWLARAAELVRSERGA